MRDCGRAALAFTAEVHEWLDGDFVIRAAAWGRDFLRPALAGPGRHPGALGVLFQVYLAGVGVFGINARKVATASSLWSSWRRGAVRSSNDHIEKNLDHPA